MTDLDLNTLSTGALIIEHNKRCVPEQQLTSWKQSKEKLIARIMLIAPVETIAPALDLKADVGEIIQDHADETAGPDVTPLDATKAVTIGSVVSELVMDAGLSYDQICSMIWAQFPESNTSRRSVASVAARLRKSGVNVPLRRAKGELEA